MIHGLSFLLNLATGHRFAWRDGRWIHTARCDCWKLR